MFSRSQGLIFIFSFASLQFVEITKFAKSVKLNDIFTSKWSDVFLCTEFKELKEYLIEKNLLKEEN